MFLICMFLPLLYRVCGNFNYVCLWKLFELKRPFPFFIFPLGFKCHVLQSFLFYCRVSIQLGHLKQHAIVLWLPEMRLPGTVSILHTHTHRHSQQGYNFPAHVITLPKTPDFCRSPSSVEAAGPQWRFCSSPSAHWQYNCSDQSFGPFYSFILPLFSFFFRVHVIFVHLTSKILFLWPKLYN